MKGGSLLGTTGLTILLVVAPLTSSGQPAPGQNALSGEAASPAGRSQPVELAEEIFADVRVRGEPVFQVGSLNERTASERARTISRRLAGLLEQEGGPGTITTRVVEQRGLLLVEANNRVLLTVSEQDALDRGTSRQALARTWADHLNRALAPRSLPREVARRLDGAAQRLLRRMVLLLPSMLGALVIVGFTWLAALGVQRLALVWAIQTEGDHSTEVLIGRLCYGGVWVLGSIVALSVLGLDFRTLLGTLGLTRVAIGFSLKDVLSNYISGVILLAARPFRIGDQVAIDTYEGTVEQVQLRGTSVRTYDGRLVYIPNQKVFQASLVNNTASPVRRSDVIVGVAYETDLERARQVIRKAIEHLDGLEAEPAPLVLVHELAPSTVNLKARFWVNSRQRSYLHVTLNFPPQPVRVSTTCVEDTHPPRSPSRNSSTRDTREGSSCRHHLFPAEGWGTSSASGPETLTRAAERFSWVAHRSTSPFTECWRGPRPRDRSRRECRPPGGW